MKHHGTDTCVMREDHVGKPADHGLMCEECRAEDRAMTDGCDLIVEYVRATDELERAPTHNGPAFDAAMARYKAAEAALRARAGGL